MVLLHFMIVVEGLSLYFLLAKRLCLTKNGLFYRTELIIFMGENNREILDAGFSCFSHLVKR